MPYPIQLNKKPTNSRFRVKLKLAISSLLLLSTSSWAQVPISMQDAIQRTLAQHPQLASYSQQLRINQGLLQQAGTSTPMQIDLQLEDAFGTGQRSGINNMQSTLSLSWLLEQDKIDARIKVASEKGKITELERRQLVLDLATKTAGYYITLLSQQEQLKLAKLAVTQTQQALSDINKRVKAGQLNVIDQLRAKANLADKQLLVEDLTHEIETSKALLAAQWKGDTEFSTSNNLQLIPDIQQLEQAYASIRNHPKLKQFSQNQQLADSQIAQAKAEAEPAWKFSAGLRRNESVDDYALVAGISIPFGATNRNQGKIAALQAEKDKQQTDADAWLKHISTQALVLSHKLKHSRHVIEGLEQEILPVLELATDKAGIAYGKGSYSYTDWYSVQQELLESRMQLIETYTNLHQDNIQLQRLTATLVSL